MLTHDADNYQNIYFIGSALCTALHFGLSECGRQEDFYVNHHNRSLIKYRPMRSRILACSKWPVGLT